MSAHCNVRYDISDTSKVCHYRLFTISLCQICGGAHLGVRSLYLALWNSWPVHKKQSRSDEASKQWSQASASLFLCNVSQQSLAPLVYCFKLWIPISCHLRVRTLSSHTLVRNVRATWPTSVWCVRATLDVDEWQLVPPAGMDSYLIICWWCVILANVSPLQCLLYFVGMSLFGVSLPCFGDIRQLCGCRYCHTAMFVKGEKS